MATVADLQVSEERQDALREIVGQDAREMPSGQEVMGSSWFARRAAEILGEFAGADAADPNRVARATAGIRTLCETVLAIARTGDGEATLSVEAHDGQTVD